MSERRRTVQLRRLWPYVRPHAVLASALLLCCLGEATIRAVNPWFIRYGVDRVFPSGDRGALVRLGLAYLTVMLSQVPLIYTRYYLTARLGARVTSDLRLDLFRHLQRLPLAYYDSRPLGRLLQGLTSDVAGIGETLFSSLLASFASVLGACFGVVSMLAINPKLALWALLSIAVFIPCTQVLRRAAGVAFQASRARAAGLNGYLQERLSGMSTVQSFVQEERCQKEYGQLIVDYCRTDRRLGLLNASISAAIEAGTLACLATAIYGGSRLLAQGSCTLGDIVAMTEAVWFLFIPLRELTSQFTSAQEATAGAEKVFTILDEPLQPEGGEPSLDIHLLRELRFDGVHFNYRANSPALHGIDFTVRKGETVALVGATGAGKSTVVKLLTRLYDLPRGQGVITLDGRDIRDLSPGALRKVMLLVSQEAALFHGTVLDNISRGVAATWEPSEARRAAEEAIAKLGIGSAFARLPKGLDTNVQELGANLSGGEKQLVALVRAVLRDPEVLILDEATSAVDPALEQAIQQATAAILKSRTALVVAHRLSTIQTVDRILVFHAGRITEEGTHTDLLRLNGTYARLLRLQEAESIADDPSGGGSIA